MKVGNTMIVDNIEIINPDYLPEEFIKEEIEDLEKTQNRHIKRITFEKQDDDTCKETVEWYTVGFQRIRRITGYLVGDLNRFNDAKLSEVHDRVKHSTCESTEGK